LCGEAYRAGRHRFGLTTRRVVSRVLSLFRPEQKSHLWSRPGWPHSLVAPNHELLTSRATSQFQLSLELLPEPPTVRYQTLAHLFRPAALLGESCSSGYLAAILQPVYE